MSNDPTNPVLNHYMILLDEECPDYGDAFVRDSDTDQKEFVVCAVTPAEALRFYLKFVTGGDDDFVNRLLRAIQRDCVLFYNETVHIWRLPNTKTKGVLKWEHFRTDAAIAAERGEDDGTRVWRVPLVEALDLPSAPAFESDFQG
jgi:hypothetical protein